MSIKPPQGKGPGQRVSSARKRATSAGKKDGKLINAEESVLKAGNKIDRDLLAEKTLGSPPIKVYELNLQNCHISGIDNLDAFSRLRSLDLSHNCISKIECLQANTELRELILADNKLIKLENLERLKELSSLDVHDNYISQIGDGVRALGNLRHLRLDSNRLKTLKQLQSLPLATLNVAFNELTSLEGLPISLQSLDCSNNQINSLPSDLPRGLQDLNLSHNTVRDLAPLVSLTNLRTLDIASNGLQTLCSLPSLPTLIDLSVANNGLTTLDNIMTTCPKLELLDASNNNIIELGVVEALNRLAGLLDLDLSGNPLSAHPQYRGEVLSKLPQLDALDCERVRPLSVPDESTSIQSRPTTPAPWPPTRALSTSAVEGAKLASSRKLEEMSEALREFDATFTTTYSSICTQLRQILPDGQSPPCFSNSTQERESSCRLRLREAQNFAAEARHAAYEK
eukprot:Colp12_sorted_trinity150504_noHs@15129